MKFHTNALSIVIGAGGSLTLTTSVSGRNYFNLASAPPDMEMEDDELAQAAASALAVKVKKRVVDYMHPEVGVTSVDGAAFGRNYFNRASAPDSEDDELADERAVILSEAAALKKRVVDYMHPEVGVTSVDGATFGRNYFNRASAPDSEDDELADERAVVLSEAAALKKRVVDYMHPEVGITIVDGAGAAFGRNYFNRASAPDSEDDELADERAEVLAKAKAAALQSSLAAAVKGANLPSTKSIKLDDMDNGPSNANAEKAKKSASGVSVNFLSGLSGEMSDEDEAIQFLTNNDNISANLSALKEVLPALSSNVSVEATPFFSCWQFLTPDEQDRRVDVTSKNAANLVTPPEMSGQSNKKKPVGLEIAKVFILTVLEMIMSSIAVLASKMFVENGNRKGVEAKIDRRGMWSRRRSVGGKDLRYRINFAAGFIHSILLVFIAASPKFFVACGDLPNPWPDPGFHWHSFEWLADSVCGKRIPDFRCICVENRDAPHGGNIIRPPSGQGSDTWSYFRLTHFDYDTGNWYALGTCGQCAPGQFLGKFIGTDQSPFLRDCEEDWHGQPGEDCKCSITTYSKGNENKKNYHFYYTCSVDSYLMNPPGSDYVVCTKCPVGTYLRRQGDKICLACPVGTYTDTEGSSECKKCPPGTYTDKTGTTECTPCPAGKYQGSEGKTSCIECQPGSYSPSEGSTVCQICPHGSYAETAASTCTEADPGHYVGYGHPRAAKYPCPAGSFTDTPGQSRCVSCPDGYSTTGISSTSSSDCIECVHGVNSTTLACLTENKAANLNNLCWDASQLLSLDASSAVYDLSNLVYNLEGVGMNALISDTMSIIQGAAEGTASIQDIQKVLGKLENGQKNWVEGVSRNKPSCVDAVSQELYDKAQSVTYVSMEASDWVLSGGSVIVTAQGGESYISVPGGNVDKDARTTRTFEWPVEVSVDMKGTTECFSMQIFPEETCIEDHCGYFAGIGGWGDRFYYRLNDTSPSNLQKADFETTTNMSEWHTVKIRLLGDFTNEYYLDGNLIYSDVSSYPDVPKKGHIRFSGCADGIFKNVVVKSLNMFQYQFGDDYAQKRTEWIADWKCSGATFGCTHSSSSCAAKTCFSQLHQNFAPMLSYGGGITPFGNYPRSSTGRNTPLYSPTFIAEELQGNVKSLVHWENAERSYKQYSSVIRQIRESENATKKFIENAIDATLQVQNVSTSISLESSHTLGSLYYRQSQHNNKELLAASKIVRHGPAFCPSGFEITADVFPPECTKYETLVKKCSEEIKFDAMLRVITGTMALAATITGDFPATIGSFADALKSFKAIEKLGTTARDLYNAVSSAHHGWNPSTELPPLPKLYADGAYENQTYTDASYQWYLEAQRNAAEGLVIKSTAYWDHIYIHNKETYQPTILIPPNCPTYKGKIVTALTVYLANVKDMSNYGSAMTAATMNLVPTLGNIASAIATHTAISNANKKIEGMFYGPSDPKIVTAPTTYQHVYHDIFYFKYTNTSDTIIAYSPALSLAQQQYTGAKSIFGFCTSYSFMNAGLQYIGKTNGKITADCQSFGSLYLPTYVAFQDTVSYFVKRTYSSIPSTVQQLNTRIEGFAANIQNDPTAVGQTRQEVGNTVETFSIEFSFGANSSSVNYYGDLESGKLRFTLTPQSNLMFQSTKPFGIQLANPRVINVQIYWRGVTSPSGRFVTTTITPTSAHMIYPDNSGVGTPYSLPPYITSSGAHEFASFKSIQVKNDCSSTGETFISGDDQPKWIDGWNFDFCTPYSNSFKEPFFGLSEYAFLFPSAYTQWEIETDYHEWGDNPNYVVDKEMLALQVVFQYVPSSTPSDTLHGGSEKCFLHCFPNILIKPGVINQTPLPNEQWCDKSKCNDCLARQSFNGTEFTKDPFCICNVWNGTTKTCTPSDGFSGTYSATFVGARTNRRNLRKKQHTGAAKSDKDEVTGAKSGKSMSDEEMTKEKVEEVLQPHLAACNGGGGADPLRQGIVEVIRCNAEKKDVTCTFHVEFLQYNDESAVSDENEKILVRNCIEDILRNDKVLQDILAKMEICKIIISRDDDSNSGESLEVSHYSNGECGMKKPESDLFERT